MIRATYEPAPDWVEQTAPRRLLRHDAPALLLLNLPGAEESYQVATAEESNAIADPNSFMGKLLRPYCALMSLPYTSSN